MILNWGDFPKLKGLIVTGSTTQKLLDDFQINNEILVLEPSQKNPESLERLAKNLNKEPLIAVGGGTTIDSTKKLSNLLGVDWYSIPTALSHDGIASTIISLHPYRDISREPLAIFGVKSFLKNNSLNLAGLGDMFAKYSSLADWKLAHERNKDEFSLESFKLLEQSLRICEKDEERLFRSLVLSGIAMTRFGSSRPASGGEHAISHSLNGGQHGMKVALSSLFTLALFEKAGLDRLLLISSSELKKKMEVFGLPTTLKDLKLTKNEFVNAVLNAPKLRDRWGILNEVTLSKTYVKNIVDDLDF